MAMYKLITAASTNLTQIKAGAGRLLGYTVTNRNVAARAVKIYDALSANVTVGTTTPAYVIDAAPANNTSYKFAVPLALNTALTIATVTENADSGTTAVSANDLTIELEYR